MKRNTSILLAGAVAAVLPLQAHAAITLGTAGNFAVLAGTTVTNTGASAVGGGNIGVWSGTSITGFPPGTLASPYSIYAGGAVPQQAQGDLTTAYNNTAGLAAIPLSGVLGNGQTLTPGVYKISSSATLAGTLVLNDQGASNAQFVFQIGSTITTATGSAVTIINSGGGTNPGSNVFWQVGSSATLGTNTAFEGHILALTSITLDTGATILDGSALARNGAVTLDANSITNAVSAAPAGFVWNGSGTDWSTASDWTAAGPPTLADNAEFNNVGAANRAVTFSSNGTALDITFDQATAYTIGSPSAHSLTLGSGGTLQMLSTDTVSQTINEPLVLDGNYYFTNNSTTSTAALTIGGSITGTASTGSTDTLTLAGSNTGTQSISGIISDGSNGGNVALDATSGVWNLAALNTYSGGTTIMGGATVGISSDASLGATSQAVTLDGGTLAYTGTSAVTIANAINVTGSGSTNVLTNSSSGTETITGAITNTTAGNILTFNNGTFNLNEAGSGAGTFDIGTAPTTVMVSNANAFGSGAIVVNTGSTLETNDAVAGSGSVLAITGSTYTQNANTTLKLLATGNGVNDSIQLGSGTASLNGELNLIFSGFTPAAGQHYTVIGTTGAVTGNFSSIVLTGAPSLLSATGNYISGTGEIIDLAYLAFFANTSSFNPNQASVANDLNTNAVSSSTPSTIQNAMIALSSLSPSQQANYLNELTPQAYYDLPQQSIQNNTFMAQQVFNQVQNSFDGGGFNTSGLMMLKTNDQDPFAVSMDAAMQSAQQQARNSVAYMDASPQLVGMPGVGPMVPGQESPLSNLSGFVLGTITVDQLQQNNTPTEHFTTGSVMAGLDYRLNRNLVVGALFNWGYTGGTMDNVGSRQRSSSYTPGVFVGYKQGGFYADGLMSYTYNSYQINRSVNMPGSSSIATGEPYSNEYDANALVGYYLPIARGFQAGPAAGAGFTQVNIGGFHETGSPFDLTVAKQHADSLRSLLGMQALYSFAPENNPLPISINFNAFWQHEFLDSSRDINASFTQLGGGNFIYNTAGPSRDSALLGLGASGYITQQVSLFVNYETQVGDHRQFAQTVMAGVAVSF